MRMQNIDGRQPWFRAKKYGWGWSWPLAWQGWLVLGLYCALVVFGALRFASTYDMTLIAGFVLLTLLFMATCWITGEKPRWRSGDDEQNGR